MASCPSRTTTLPLTMVHALLGLALWQLDEPQAAAVLLERARRAGDARAGLNLAGLYASYGYMHAARQVMPAPNKLSDIDADAADVAPPARELLRRQGGAG